MMEPNYAVFEVQNILVDVLKFPLKLTASLKMVINYGVLNVFNFDLITSQSVTDTHSSVNVICRYGLTTDQFEFT